MTPGDFIAKWRASELKESSAAQEHFIDLCRLLGEPTPAEADPTGDRYCFERGARKDTGGEGRWTCATRWRNPPEWVEWSDEAAPGYPNAPSRAAKKPPGPSNPAP